MNLNELHDGKLTSMTFAWHEGEVTLLCESSEAFEIRATGVRSLSVERFLSWGPAATIYESELDLTYALGPKLSLVMQTGDPIRIIAEEFQVKMLERRVLAPYLPLITTEEM